MNIFRKLFGKTKIEEVVKHEVDKPELVILSRYIDKSENMYITCLCVFDISYLKDFTEVISTNKLRTSIKFKDNKAYIYFAVSDVKGLMNNLSPNNSFFSVLKELLTYFNISYCKEYYKDGIIDKSNRDMEMINEVELYKLIKVDLNQMNNDIFTFRDLSTVVDLYPFESLYDILTNDDKYYLEGGLLFEELSKIYGDEVLSSLRINKYEEEYKDIDIENLISEDLDEVQVITEDEDGNLIYDKTQFE